MCVIINYFCFYLFFKLFDFFSMLWCDFEKLIPLIINEKYRLRLKTNKKGWIDLFLRLCEIRVYIFIKKAHWTQMHAYANEMTYVNFSPISWKAPSPRGNIISVVIHFLQCSFYLFFSCFILFLQPSFYEYWFIIIRLMTIVF